MKIELYVVKPYKDITRLTYEEKQAIDKLEALKVQLCKQFGGLTESATAKGYWLNNGKLIHDDVTVWTIFSTTDVKTSDVENIGETVRKICSQEVQLIVINDKPTFLNGDPCLTCSKKISCELCEHTEGED
jgi:hypothetical protein